MIYRVVIIDNGNQVSLTQQGGVLGMEGRVDDEVRLIMEQALDKLKEVQDIDGERKSEGTHAL